jgi:endonuclease YncB( thermonuclease family)
MRRLLREIVQTMAALPLYIKLTIAAALVLNFIVITQWERLWNLASPSATQAQNTGKPEPTKFDFDTPPAATDFKSDEAQAFLAKRMTPMTIYDPKIERDGRIVFENQSIFLYGVKRFDARNVCTRASGDRWACGLQAYATLRNEVANKTIVCQPKKLIDAGVIAACRLDNQDLALFLIAKGLIEAERDGEAIELVQAEAQARKERVGIWDK